MRKKLLAGLATGLMLVMISSAASAIPVYFTDRTAFDAATGGGLNFESFENNFATAATIAFTDFTVSETNGINILGQLRDFPGIVNGITDGTGALVYDDNGSSLANFFNFTSSITAFGLDIATSTSSTMTIGFDGHSTSLGLAADVPAFWGVVDYDGFSSLTFDASGGPNVGFDAASYGNANAPVPEPATMLLFGVGLAGLAGRRIRRKKK